MDSFKVETVVAQLRTDIQEHDQCNVKVVLGHFLKRCLLKNDNDVDPQTLLQKCVDAVLPICNDKDVHDLATEYCNVANKEQDRYPRFAKWFNTVLEKLSALQTTSAGAGTLASLGLRDESSLGVMFHRCDPKEDTATHGARRPGIGVVSTDTTRTRLGYSWDELLSVLEFKLTDKTLTRPPQTYGNTLKKHIPAVSDVSALSPKHSALEAWRSQTAPSLQPPPVLDYRTDAEIFHAERKKRRARLQLEMHALNSNGPRPSTNSDANTTPEDDVTQPKSGTTSDVTSSSVAPAAVEPDTKETPPLIQNAMYGAELLCHGKYTTHAISILIADEIAWVWWFDHQGAIQSTGIDFIHDLPYFVALLVAFQRFMLEDWGIPETMLTSSNFIADDPLAEVEADFPDFMTVSAQAIHYSDHFSVAERLFAVPAGYDKPLYFALTLHWPEGMRQTEAPIIGKAADSKDGYMKGHRSELMSAFDWEYSTGMIHNELRISPCGNSLVRLPRAFRLLLFKETVPLNADGSIVWLDADFETSRFMGRWVQWYQCHRILWIYGIEHVDISLENMMYDDDTGTRIATDFDLANTERDHIVSRRRTGDPLFTALDLLTRKYYDGMIKRRYRHHLEAFVWVLASVTLCRSKIYAYDLGIWKTADYKVCNRFKTAFAYSPFENLSQDDVDQEQWTLTRHLMKWLAGKLVTSRDPFVTPPEQSDEDVLRKFEDVVAAHWSSAWPAFNRLTSL